MIEVAFCRGHFGGRLRTAFFVKYLVAEFLAGENLVLGFRKADLKPLKLSFVAHDNTLLFICPDFARELREGRVKGL